MAEALKVQFSHNKIAVNDQVEIKVKDLDTGRKVATTPGKCTTAGTIEIPVSLPKAATYLIRVIKIEAEDWAVKDTEKEKDVGAGATENVPFEVKKLRKRPKKVNAADRDEDVEIQLTKDVLTVCCALIDQRIASGKSIDAIQDEILDKITKLVESA